MFGRLLLGMDRPPGTPIVTCERCGKPMLGGEELPQHINQRRPAALCERILIAAESDIERCRSTARILEDCQS
eukprot:3262754-Amphidinium_carterae.1